MNQSELEAKTCNRRRAQENVYKQVMIAFGFTSDWSRKRRESKTKTNANCFQQSIENRSILNLKPRKTYPAYSMCAALDESRVRH